MSSTLTIGGKTVQDITIGAKQVQSIYDNTNQVLLWEKAQPNYFYFEDRSGAANSISITKTGDLAEWLSLEYSTNKNTWSTWDFAQVLTLPANGKVYLRGSNTYGFGKDNSNYHTFNCTGNYALGGNIWSVMSDNVSVIPDRFGSRTFQGSTTLVDISNLSIPNMPIGTVTFTWMFASCTNLTTAMENIPVTYYNQAGLADNSHFYQMFIRNANQLNFPRFPNVTRLSKQGMHQILVQTTSATNNALNYVDLSSIETVINQSLNQAFLHCQALEVVKIGISEWGTYDDSEAYNYRSTYQWLGDVHSTGVFCKNATLPVTRGLNYIPNNWSIADLNGKLYAPVITENSGEITIEESDGGASCQIYYTTDGTTPTPQNGTLYTQPFNVASGTTVKAIVHYAGSRSDLITDSDYDEYYVEEETDCTDCTNWEECGYSSYEECQCQVNGIGCPVDCSDYESMGYASPEECDCAENNNCPEIDCTDYENMGYESEEECNCRENGVGCPEETDCSDCNNWVECGYESYEDCDCQVNGNCEEEPEEEFTQPTLLGGIAETRELIDGDYYTVYDIDMTFSTNGVSGVTYTVEQITGGSSTHNYAGSGNNSTYNFTKRVSQLGVDGRWHFYLTQVKDGQSYNTTHYAVDLNQTIIEIVD